MLDINYIRKNPKELRKNIKERNMKVDIEALLKLDKKRREQLQKIEDLRSMQNNANQEIAKSQGAEKQKKILEMKAVAQRLKEAEPTLEKIDKKFNKLMYALPNIQLGDVPVGKNETENVIVKKIKEPVDLGFKPKDHMELGEALGIIDMKKASKIAGARFAYLMGAGAMLEVAIINYVFAVLTDQTKLKKIADKVRKGYNPKPFIPVFPPIMINPDVFTRMGRLTEEDKDERYYIQQDDKYLIGSAEHTMGPLHMDETLSEEDLPIRYVGFSTSLRREAGSYGKDTKGILRMHQFDKLEMETFVRKEDGKTEQDFIVAIQEYLISKLDIPYQVVAICTGDMGKPDARQIDIESWMPSQGKYRETHTSDYMTDFQARRLGTKYKTKEGTKEFVHMNDATAFAIGRILIAIIENNQNKDGSINVPEALWPYMNGIKTIE